jgi:hypothetical protein
MTISIDPRSDRRSPEATDENDPIVTRCEKAARYRLMADEVRSAADEMHDLVSRQTLRRIADDYERLALRSERRLREASNGAAARGRR